MTISLQYCNITVDDIDKSLDFYHEALGLELRNDVASGRFRWVTLGSASQPGLGIVLSEPHAGRSQADGDVLQEPMDQAWGPRDCAFRDPSGNTVRIAQAPR